MVLLLSLLLSTSTELAVESERDVGRLCADGDVECDDDVVEGSKLPVEEEEEEIPGGCEEAEDDDG